ncbi:MAG TPA: hypothetical protein DD727_04630 [Clostridiales bacterium]|nr:hypothetical protein [Clostridiales bacterium]
MIHTNLRYDLDLKDFWRKDARAHQENCFDPQAEQVAFGISMGRDCIFAELGEEGDPWGYTPSERMMELIKRYNEKAEIVIGKRALSEKPPLPEDARFPGIRQAGEIFKGKYTQYNGTLWLSSEMQTPRDLERTLDEADRINTREFILPRNWESEKKRIFEKYGIRPGGFFGFRGPVTFAMSLYGVENLIYLILDEPDLAIRFRDAILRVILEIWRIMAEESGYDPDTMQKGFRFNDDNCAMLTAPMYELFGYPVLKKVFEVCAPIPFRNRYQHSDSDMGHLLPILGTLDFTGVNFGPSVMVREIRKSMPRTRIDGQLAPFTLMRNDEDRIIAEVRRDCEAAKACGRGLNLTTAGSLNPGTLLSSVRAAMYAVQEYGQYDSK